MGSRTGCPSATASLPQPPYRPSREPSPPHHAHRNAELGPGGVGAPAGNLNALKTGRRAHPLSADELSATSDALLAQPDDLPARMAHLTRLIMTRTEDPLLTLVALRALFSQVIEAYAARIFERELGDALAPLPAPLRDRQHAQISALSAVLGPEQRLWMLRRALCFRKKGSR